MTTKPDQVYTSFIKSTPEKVWAAITNPEFTRQYWGGAENISDWKKGAKWKHMFPKRDDDAWIVGEVLESVPPRRLVLSWASPDKLEDVSHVTFEIEQMAGVTKLVVVHGDFKPGSEMADKVAGGWPKVLSSMKSFLETGSGFDVFCGSGQCEK